MTPSTIPVIPIRPSTAYLRYSAQHGIPSSLYLAGRDISCDTPLPSYQIHETLQAIADLHQSCRPIPVRPPEPSSPKRRRRGVSEIPRNTRLSSPPSHPNEVFPGISLLRLNQSLPRLVPESRQKS